MRTWYVRMLLILLTAGFCIFFGVDLATRGVERIQGPIYQSAVNVNAAGEGAAVKSGPTPAKPGAQAEGPHAAAAGKAKAAAEPKSQPEPKDVEPKEDISEASGINLLGNKVGELLQIIAHHGIRWFVALFDAITG
ncbi:hypothetical protein ACHHV8_08970 [Paenibacillus sp. TAB 01]|uniref:hypothetical protein n=1 Tax=Paenibacillus sp. TAB 01 TaxID=3368988 RepID=UPI0037501271